jgi:hypothetical protein
MRDDMDEVIIERPRWGSRMRHVRRLRRVDPKHAARHDPDSLPLRIGLKRAASLGKITKSLSDLLGPLKRYLTGQVNRPWNKVWSEISANLKASNPVQQHVRDHVIDFVAVNTSIRDGVVWVAREGSRPVPLSESWSLLYVDPRTGILRRNKHYQRYPQRRREQAAADARERAHRMRELGPFLQVHLLKDCWWEVTLAPVPAEHAWRNWPPVSDVVHDAGLSALPPHELYARRGVYAVKRRQLKSAEIARLGLKR